MNQLNTTTHQMKILHPQKKCVELLSVEELHLSAVCEGVRELYDIHTPVQISTLDEDTLNFVTLETDSALIDAWNTSLSRYAVPHFYVVGTHTTHKKLHKFLQRQRTTEVLEDQSLSQSDVTGMLLQLERAGHMKYPLNLRLIAKYAGDITLVLEELERKKNKRKTRTNDDDEARASRKKQKTSPEQRQLNRALRQLAQDNFHDVAVEGISPEIKHLFLDANNFFYYSPLLRSMMRNRGVKKVEKLLVCFAKALAAKLPTISHCTVVFDNSKLSELCTLENGVQFEVLCGKPAFHTSDDYFIHWSNSHPELAPMSLFITSDVLLGGHLVTAHSLIAKTGSFFSFSAQLLSPNEVFEKSHQWFDTWAENYVEV